MPERNGMEDFKNGMEDNLPYFQTNSIQDFVHGIYIKIHTNSSVARGAGGLEPPIGLKSMQNTTFLVLLRPIFAPKMKIAPPKGIGEQSCEGLGGIWTRKLDFFSGPHLKLVRKTK